MKISEFKTLLGEVMFDMWKTIKDNKKFESVMTKETIDDQEYEIIIKKVEK